MNERWMTSLPQQTRDLPIINLAIPGSHNSMMYGITSRVAPDANKTIRRLNFCFPFFVRRWSKTQSASILEQLALGVRYFDLRVAQDDNNFYYVHGLFAMEVFEPLWQLKEYLLKNPGEVVILDFQHFYALSVTHHIELHKRLLGLFGQILYGTNEGSLQECTLTRCTNLRKQIILIYRRCPISLPPEFWPSYTYPNPWPNVDSIKKLQEFLQNAILSRKPSQGYVSQCVLTPTGRYIALRFYSSLRKMAKRVDRKLEPWIIEQKPGPVSPAGPAVNVFISDFVNIKDGEFCNWVISLNSKLINDNNEFTTIDTDNNLIAPSGLY